MPPTQATPVAALRRLTDSGPDEELLLRFCADRDEAAFAAIVRRHGGLVLDVCRTVLRNEADAEDAFQATFVALAAAAGRVRRPAALAGWLHAVACRTAGKARRARHRRRAHEARVPARPDAAALDPSWAEIRQAVHEEVNRLPDRYRVSIVLFYLAGRTQDEVGRALGLSTAGAKKRLEVGRALLRSALDGRGFGPTVVLAAAAITVPAPVPALAATAIELSIRYLTNRGAVPTAVLSLLSSGARPMSAKIVFGAALLLGVATTVGLAGSRGGAPDESARPEDPPAKAKGPEPARPAPRTVAGDEPEKKSPPPPADEMDRFRALGPAERLKFVEKVAGTGTPFTAATRGDLVDAIVERGSIESANSFDVICKVKAKDKASTAATTIKWLIDEGSLVKKGDRLALLDDAGVRDRIQAATVKAKTAEAAMVRAAENAGLIQKDNEVEVKLAEIDVKLAEAELTDSVAGKARQVAELKIEQAKLKLERARTRAKGQLAKAEADQRAKVAVWEQEVQRQRDCEAELKLCELLAPADGIVAYPVPAAGRFGGAAVPLAPGEPVREGQKVVSVADLKQLVLATQIREAWISTLRVGQESRVQIDAFPDKVCAGR